MRPTPVQHAALVAEALGGDGVRVVRLAPTADPFDLVAAAVARGDALVLAPSVAGARRLGLRLRRAGLPVAILPEDWARARSGAAVVGARAAAWAPMRDLAAVVVLDEHDEVYQEERAPTWHARDVVVERARRAGVPCVLHSPCPSLEAQQLGPVLTPGRAAERQGWPKVDVVDLRREDPVRGGSLVSERLARVVQEGTRVVCVLNRKGRARLLACKSCRELTRCEACDAAVVQDDDGTLRCPRCGTVRPPVCLHCGAGAFRIVRGGVGKLRDDLALLAPGGVVEHTGDGGGGDADDAQVHVGTEAVLHRVRSTDVVAFVDLDQELLAPATGPPSRRWPCWPGPPAWWGRAAATAACWCRPTCRVTRSCRRPCSATPLGSRPPRRPGGPSCGSRLSRPWPMCRAPRPRPSSPPSGRRSASRSSARSTDAGCCGLPTTARCATPSPTRPAPSAASASRSTPCGSDRLDVLGRSRTC